MSNLKNQPTCNAHSKRTGLPCSQPRIRGKAVCRFHGGKSTGPKTLQGRQRIREAHLIHGRYSKVNEEHKLAIKRLRLEKEIWEVQERVLEKHIERAQSLAPYFQALNRAQSREEYGLLRMFLFGGLNQLVKTNPILRKHLRELFDTLFEGDALERFEALTSELERYVCQKVSIPVEVWRRLNPSERYEAYIQQLLEQVSEVWPEIHAATQKSVVLAVIS